MPSYISKLAREQGLKMEDAEAPLSLTVKQLDVSRADMKNPGSCAFSRACKRELKCKSAYFFRSTAWVQNGDTMTRYLLPPSMQKEIVAFDRNKSMAPGTYHLSPPGRSLRLEEVRKRSRKYARKRAKGPKPASAKRRVLHRTKGIRGGL